MRARAARLERLHDLDPAAARRCQLFARQFVEELEALAKSAIGEAHLAANELVGLAEDMRAEVLRVLRRYGQ